MNIDRLHLNEVEPTVPSKLILKLKASKLKIMKSIYNMNLYK